MTRTNPRIRGWSRTWKCGRLTDLMLSARGAAWFAHTDQCVVQQCVYTRAPPGYIRCLLYWPVTNVQLVAASARNFHLGSYELRGLWMEVPQLDSRAIVQKFWGGSPPLGSQSYSSWVWGGSPPVGPMAEVKAVCTRCLQISSTETIKIWKF